ncbi:hypothetical protein [Micromonospora sp. DT62]|uniref:hypothetical protein n=1 Tax=Micromonospora sp. DT62 TaxID=3416521 RepID=UPI003CF4947E
MLVFVKEAPGKKSAVSQRLPSDQVCEKNQDITLEIRFSRSLVSWCGSAVVAALLGIAVWFYPEVVTPVAVALTTQAALQRSIR